jgi:hypothetical protein
MIMRASDESSPRRHIRNRGNAGRVLEGLVNVYQASVREMPPGKASQEDYGARTGVPGVPARWGAEAALGSCTDENIQRAGLPHP